MKAARWYPGCLITALIAMFGIPAYLEWKMRTGLPGGMVQYVADRGKTWILDRRGIIIANYVSALWVSDKLLVGETVDPLTVGKIGLCRYFIIRPAERKLHLLAGRKAETARQLLSRSAKWRRSSSCVNRHPST